MTTPLPPVNPMVDTPVKDQIQALELLLRGYGPLKRNLSLHLSTPEKILSHLHQHISTHKWLINEKIPFEITLEQALFSWYENVYLPMDAAILKARAYSKMPSWSGLAIFNAVSDEYWWRSSGRTIYIDPVYAVYGVLKNKAKHWWDRAWASVLDR